MSEGPDSWIDCRFDTVARVVSGKNQKEVECPSGSYPIYGSGGSFGMASDFICGPGTTVIGRKGTINSPIFVNERFWNVDTAFGLCPIDAESFLPRLLFYFCWSFNFHLLDKSTTIPSLAKRDIEAIQIPLPPLAEQKRIVAKIEELFSELDAGEESLRQARQQLGVYRQSLLKQAFEGKLTTQWRAQNPDLLESPDELLDLIEEERKSNYEQCIKAWETLVNEWEAGGKLGKKPIKPRKAQIVALSEDAHIELPELPNLWIWTSLSSLSDHIVDGTHKTPKYVDDGVQFISAKDIRGFSISFDDTKFITPEEHAELCRRCAPTAGDILLTKSGTIGRVAVVTATHEFSVFESVAVIPISRSVDARFFAFQIFYMVQGSFGAKNQKGVAVRHLHLEDIRRLPSSLPPLPEQKEIVRILDEQFDVIEQNEQEIDAALKRSEALRQSILHKAFTGQLVPQDPTDEPAAVLLARIRAEREAAAKLAKPKKKAAKKKAARKKAEPAPSAADADPSEEPLATEQTLLDL